MNTQLSSTPAHFPVPPGAAAYVQPSRSGQVPDTADFRRLLGRFEPIGLAQMDAVALLDRTATKYVLHASQLYTALAGLSSDYQVLDIGVVRLHPYRTLYFDTADLALYMRHHAGRQHISLPGLAIAEVKQEGINRHSDFVRQMRAMAIHTTGFSKYCVGTALLNPTVKHNNFKDKLRLVERLVH